MIAAQTVALAVAQEIPIAVIKDLSKQAMGPENRRRALLALWIISVLLLLIVTVVLVYGLFFITSSYKPGIILATFFWALFFGICALLFLPSKAITALFGSILGISINEAGTPSGLLTKVNEEITNMAGQISVIVSGQGQNTDPFISGVIWMFVIIVALICLPAFVRD